MASDVRQAPAKLTLRLHVVGVRADGYHLLDAEMTSVGLFDTLEIGPGTGLEVLASASLPAGPGNLVHRALALAGRQARVRLTKRIPVGAGLGGGSSDAAAILRWAGLGGEEHLPLAARLGADVPFCLVGGRAVVGGIGERLRRLAFVPARYALVTPPLAVSTPLVYKAWDALGGPRAEVNDLERAALAVSPQLERWRDAFWSQVGSRPVLAGSGSTWYLPLGEADQEPLPRALSVDGASARVRVVEALRGHGAP